MKNKRGISGINLIVAAVIGLIIIIVVVMMLTGKLGAFGKGTEDAVTGSAEGLFDKCSDACKLIGKVKTTALYDVDSCSNNVAQSLNPQSLPGTYSDISSGNVCCCRNK